MKGLMVSLLFVCMTGIVVGQQSDSDGQASASSSPNFESSGNAMFSPSLRPPSALRSKSTGIDFARARGLERPGPDDSDGQSVLQVDAEQSTTTSRQANSFDGSSNQTDDSSLRFDFQLTPPAFNAIRSGKKIEAAVEIVDPRTNQLIPARQFGEIAFFHSDNVDKNLTAQAVEPVPMLEGSTTLRFEVDENQLTQLEERSLYFRVPDELRGQFNKVEIAGKRPASVLDTGGSFGMENRNAANIGGWNVAPVPGPGPNYVPGEDLYVGPVIDDQEIFNRRVAAKRRLEQEEQRLLALARANRQQNLGFDSQQQNSNDYSVNDQWDQQQEQEKQRLLDLARANRPQSNPGFDSSNQSQNDSQNYQLIEYRRRLQQTEAALAASQKAEQQYLDRAKLLYQQNVGLNQEQLAMKEQLERRNTQPSNTMAPVGSNSFGSNRTDFVGSKQLQPTQPTDPNYQFASLQQQLEKAKSDNEYLKWQQDNLKRQYDVAKSRQDQKYEESILRTALNLMPDRINTKPVSPTSGNFDPNGITQGNRGQQESERWADLNSLPADQLALLKARLESETGPSVKKEFIASVPGPGKVTESRQGPPNNNGQNRQLQPAMDANDYSKTLMALLFLLFGSIGLNLYLGWLCRSWYVQYGFLSEELREMFSASSSKI